MQRHRKRPAMTARIDMETASILLVGISARRALGKAKNRAKGMRGLETMERCADLLDAEIAEMWDAWHQRHLVGLDPFIDEVGDVIATAGLCLWRAAKGDERG